MSNSLGPRRRLSVHFALTLTDNIKESFGSVYASEDTIKSLKDVMLPVLDPEAFKIGVLSRYGSLGILLYGPPGTGKTLLVRALAKQVNARVLAISGADIRSPYLGGGEKKIQRMFRYARQHHPCIIFVDEADSLFRSRSADCANRGCRADLDQFLLEMEGIHSDSATSPVVIAASNRPFDMDEAVLRRLGRRILVDIPDATGREEILKILLEGETTEVSLAEVARSTADYMGSDLRDLVYQAAIMAVREMYEAAPAQGGSGTGQSSAKSSGARRVLRQKHFDSARREIRPAPKSELVAKIRDFHCKLSAEKK